MDAVASAVQGRRGRMKVYKCDRCGKELAHHDRNRIDVREWDNTRYSFDLCNECFKEFDNFIYGKGGRE